MPLLGEKVTGFIDQALDGKLSMVGKTPRVYAPGTVADSLQGRQKHTGQPATINVLIHFYCLLFIIFHIYTVLIHYFCNFLFTLFHKSIVSGWQLMVNIFIKNILKDYTWQDCRTLYSSSSFLKRMVKFLGIKSRRAVCWKARQLFPDFSGT